MTNERQGRRTILVGGLGAVALAALGCEPARGYGAGQRRVASANQPYMGSGHAPAPPAISTPAPYGSYGSAAPSGGAPVCALTEANIEGPFFKAGAPTRAELAPRGSQGVPLVLSGRVFDARCEPLVGARLEIWHADHAGAYDNAGFDFRGLVETDRDGCWSIQSVVPGHYLNGAKYRPAHVHAKVHAAGFAPLTTQLYFAGDPYNEIDPFIRESLIMPVQRTGLALACSYDFVLARG